MGGTTSGNRDVIKDLEQTFAALQKEIKNLVAKVQNEDNLSLQNALTKFNTAFDKNVARFQTEIKKLQDRLLAKEGAWNDVTSKLKGELKSKESDLKAAASKWKMLIREKEKQYKNMINQLKDELKEKEEEFSGLPKKLAKEYRKKERILKEEAKELKKELVEAKKSIWNRLFPSD